MLITRALTLVGGVALAVTLAACGSSTTPAASSSSEATTSAVAPSTTAPSMSSSAARTGASSESIVTSESMTSSMTTPSMATPPVSGSALSGSALSGSALSGEAAPAALVGPGCADYAAAVPSGAGSVEGMAADPVAVAASNNPLLTSLTAALSGTVNPQVNLVSTLNNGEFTVFAPVDAAFAKIDATTMDSLATNAALLTGILTYHVVPGKLSPTEVVGTHSTANGATLTVTRSGDTLKVNGATVICGGVQTKNATVYLIDQVLTPPAG
jgi:uncharacterized surface protein with fasciclin (FAS1) repeats